MQTRDMNRWEYANEIYYRECETVSSIEVAHV